MELGINSGTELKMVLTPNACWCNASESDDYTDIVVLAQNICGAQLVSLGMCGVGYFLNNDLTGLHRGQLLFCEGDFGAGGILEVPDARLDERLFEHAFVAGSPFVRSVVAAPFFGADGRYLGYLCVMGSGDGADVSTLAGSLLRLSRQAGKLHELKKEVTELQENEARARGSEVLMKSIFCNAISAVVVLDEKARILQWNPKAEQIFGWGEREVFGKHMPQLLLSGQDVSGFGSILQRYAESDSVILDSTFELSATSKDGRPLFIDLGVSKGALNGRELLICFMSDVTERKVAGRELEKQRTFYENILNSLPSDIVVFDPDHRYLFVNPGAISDAVHRQFIIGKDDFQYCAYRNRDMELARLRRKMFLQIKETKQEIKWEDTVTGPNGKRFTSLRRIFPVYDEAQELSMVIGYGLDITDRKVMEEQQNNLVRQLSEQNTQLVDFCNIVSHNLRAPLVNMSLLVQYLQESEDEADRRDLTNKLQPVVEGLHATFNHLVESIQIKQNLDIPVEQLELAACMQQVLGELKDEPGMAEAEVIAAFEAAPKIWFPYPYAISVLKNLVSNALKYRSPARKLQIRISTTRTDATTTLTIADNGLGIDTTRHRDNLFKIGKVFHRHPKARGFGLFIAKTQVEAMGGRIWVESAPDAGATFFVEFKNSGQ